VCVCVCVSHHTMGTTINQCLLNPRLGASQRRAKWLLLGIVATSAHARVVEQLHCRDSQCSDCPHVTFMTVGDCYPRPVAGIRFYADQYVSCDNSMIVHKEFRWSRCSGKVPLSSRSEGRCFQGFSAPWEAPLYFLERCREYNFTAGLGADAEELIGEAWDIPDGARRLEDEIALARDVERDLLTASLPLTAAIVDGFSFVEPSSVIAAIATATSVVGTTRGSRNHTKRALKTASLPLTPVVSSLLDTTGGLRRDVKQPSKTASLHLTSDGSSLVDTTGGLRRGGKQSLETALLPLTPDGSSLVDTTGGFRPDVKQPSKTASLPLTSDGSSLVDTTGGLRRGGKQSLETASLPLTPEGSSFVGTADGFRSDMKRALETASLPLAAPIVDGFSFVETATMPVDGHDEDLLEVLKELMDME
jgi:hypothetical protein